MTSEKPMKGLLCPMTASPRSTSIFGGNNNPRSTSSSTGERNGNAENRDGEHGKRDGCSSRESSSPDGRHLPRGGTAWEKTTPPTARFLTGEDDIEASVKNKAASMSTPMLSSSSIFHNRFVANILCVIGFAIFLYSYELNPNFHGASGSSFPTAVTSNIMEPCSRSRGEFSTTRATSPGEANVDENSGCDPVDRPSDTREYRHAMKKMKKYRQMHSQKQLEREFHECRRHNRLLKTRGDEEDDEKEEDRASDLLTTGGGCPAMADRRFLVAYYSCPHQAGNRIHHFMNAVLWAMVTNRTVLWHYYDRDTCMELGSNHRVELCDMVGTKEVCDETLELASWIPSAVEWTARLGLPPPELAPWWSTHTPPGGVDDFVIDPDTGRRYRSADGHSNLTAAAVSVSDTVSDSLDLLPRDTRSRMIRDRHPWHEGDARYVGLDAAYGASRVLRIGQMHSWDAAAVLRSRRKRRYLLQTTEARRASEAIFGMGSSFAYGMVFSNTLRPTTTTTTTLVPAPSSSHEAAVSTAGGGLGEVKKISRSGGEGQRRRNSEQVGFVDDAAAMVGETGSPLLTIGLHSRHGLASDDGSDVESERRCLYQVLGELRRRDERRKSSSSFSHCAVYLMSDREVTIEKLRRFVEVDLGCQAIVYERRAPPPAPPTTPSAATLAPHRLHDRVIDDHNKSETRRPQNLLRSDHDDGVEDDPHHEEENGEDENEEDENTAAAFAEMGSHPGRGFWEELALVSSGARHGFVGLARSSSHLLEELVEYRAALEGYPFLPVKCYLADRENDLRFGEGIDDDEDEDDDDDDNNRRITTGTTTGITTSTPHHHHRYSRHAHLL